MHARELVELGAVVAAHGELFVHQAGVTVDSHLEEYWLASRSRQIRWREVIKAYQQPRSQHIDRLNWQAIRPVIEEILSSELLTRTWAAVGCVRDRHQATNELGPVVRSVLVGHLEARNRALNVMVYGDGFTVEEGVVLNRLRRHIERWTDMLLGFLMDEGDVSEFAFNAQRCREFASDLRFDEGSAADSQAARMVLASLRTAFQTRMSPISPNAELNRQIASSVLACFHQQLFDSVGLFKSLWMLRLNQVTDDTAGMIEDLLGTDEVPERPVSIRR